VAYAKAQFHTVHPTSEHCYQKNLYVLFLKCCCRHRFM